MTSKEAISKIRELLFGAETPTSEKFLKIELKEGGFLSIVEDALEVGKEIYIVSEEGELPADDGEYLTIDGVKIKVKDGKN